MEYQTKENYEGIFPQKKENQLMWAASIAQTAAIIYMGSGSETTEEKAIGKAIWFYSSIVDILDKAGELND